MMSEPTVDDIIEKPSQSSAGEQTGFPESNGAAERIRQFCNALAWARAARSLHDTASWALPKAARAGADPADAANEPDEGDRRD